MNSLSGTGAGALEQTRADSGVSRWRQRLTESKLRSRLRGHPRTQGRILGTAGLFRRLPTTSGVFFPFYHDVLPCYAGGLRRHLAAFRRTGPFLSWDEALDVLAGRREIDGPHFCLNFDDGHPSWTDVVLPILAELRVPATFFLATGIIGRDGLSWAGCREIAAAGHTIGSHTVTHRRLADLPDDEAAREVRDSKAQIEDRLGIEVRDFAAPYGMPGVDVRARDVDLVREAGYRSFATTLRVAMHPGDSPLWIGRQGLHPAWPMAAVRTRVHD